MRYSNLTKQKLSDRFSSKDFSFRPTTMSDALCRAGISSRAHMVREANIETERGVIHASKGSEARVRNALGQAVVA